MPPPKKPRCRDAPWFFLAREGLSARPEWARNRRWTMPCNVSVRGAFQLTPSARRATVQRGLAGGRTIISIHALREEGDELNQKTAIFPLRFQSTPSARRATPALSVDTAGNLYFNPRPPRGGRRTMSGFKSTTSLISIHALREEGDSATIMLQKLLKLFQSTLSVGRATTVGVVVVPVVVDFNPRSPRGGRPGD